MTLLKQPSSGAAPAPQSPALLTTSAASGSVKPPESQEHIRAKLHANIFDDSLSGAEAKDLTALVKSLDSKDIRNIIFAKATLSHLKHSNNPAIAPLLGFLSKSPDNEGVSLALYFMFTSKDIGVLTTAAEVIKKGAEFIDQAASISISKLTHSRLVNHRKSDDFADALVIVQAEAAQNNRPLSLRQKLWRAILMTMREGKRINYLNLLAAYIVDPPVDATSRHTSSRTAGE